jgi:hypothetical protein
MPLRKEQTYARRRMLSSARAARLRTDLPNCLLQLGIMILVRRAHAWQAVALAPCAVIRAAPDLRPDHRLPRK